MYQKTKWDRFWKKLMYPRIYTLYQTAFGVHLLPDCRRKKILQWILLKLSPEHNYAIRLLCNDKTVTKEQVDSYVSVSGDWWTSDKRKEMLDREHRILSDEENEFNNIDKELIVKLYKELHK